MSNYTANSYEEDVNHPWYKISRMIPDGSRVLDIGCSSGNMGGFLTTQKGCEVVGLDLDAKDVALAKKQLVAAYVKNVESDDLTSLGKFDCVIFSDVIEHLLDPVATLIKIRKSLKSSGSVLFSIPNMAHMAVRLMLLDGRFEYGETGLLDKTHLHYYDRQEVERVFKDAGYTFKEFSWGARPLAESLLKKQLQHMGLNPSQAFLDRRREVEGAAYEFIGQAVPGDRPSKRLPRPFASPRVLTEPEKVEALQNELRLNEEENGTLRKENARLWAKNEDLLAQKALILSSASWRITRPVRIVGSGVRKVVQRLRQLRMSMQKEPRLHFLHYPELRRTRKSYAKSDELVDSLERSKGVEMAVVVHLYYTETWPTICKKLQNLKGGAPFDLFLTLQAADSEFGEKIRQDFPDAHILVLPNRGRDVLPFVYLAPKLYELGYEYVLKLHSKKSPHFKDGTKWFSEILDNLIPEDPRTMAAVVATLKKKKTGVIGPSGQYITLAVNFAGNSFLLSRLLTKVFSKAVAKRIAENRKDYGFFAGTMFWIRLDSIKCILDEHYGPDSFERERGPIDGTLAHTLERMFCLCPEINGKKLYEIGPGGLKAIAYKTDNIPEWSDLHPNYKKKSKS